MAQELSDKIRAAAQAKGIDPEVALRIAQAESSFNPAAKAKSSTAGGLFQVIDDTWKQYGGKPGKKFDVDENIRVGTDIIADNTKYLQTVLGRAPDPAEVYAAHYFGPSKAKAFLAADPSTPISDILPAKALKANPNLQGKTAGQVLAQLEGKVGGPAKQPAVSRETPAAPTRTPAEEAMEPALRSGMTAKASGVPRETQLASLGPSYQAALALSFLADEDKTPGEKDIDNEPSVAEQWLAQTAPKPALSMADISIKSPFGNTQAPVMMNEGGDVSTAAKMLREVVPMDLRTFGSTLLGSREPITEANFNPKELAAMQQAIDQAAARTGRPQKGTVQYVDYPRGEQIGPDYQPVGATLGRFSYEKQPDGTTVIRDRYDFYNEGRKENVEAYEKMGRGERAATVAGRMLKNLVTGDLRGVPNELADAYIGRQGRDVTIKLPVKRADGSPETGEEADLTRPATFNPNIARQGAAARRLAAMRDVNTLRDPRTYAAVTGFFGVAPDEQGFSALHPDIQGIKKAGEAGFYAGTAAQVAPAAAGARKVATGLAEIMGLGKKAAPAVRSSKEMLEETAPAAAEQPVSRETPEFFIGPDSPDAYFRGLRGLPVAAERPEIVKTPEFQERFGGSKIVDYRGQPLIMYRSTPSDEMAFQSQAERARVKGEYPSAGTNEGIYFTHQPHLSAGYGKAMYPVYLDIKNPFIIPKDAQFTVGHVAVPTKKNSATSMFVTPEHLEWYRKHGYDGIVNLASNEVVAFSPTQAISAISPKAPMNKAHGGFVSY